MIGVVTTGMAASFFCAAAMSASIAFASRAGLVEGPVVGGTAGAVDGFASGRSRFSAWSRAIFAFSRSISTCWAGVGVGSTGSSSRRSASSVWLKIAKAPKYSFWVIGSYLWSWHWAHAIVRAVKTWKVVFTRS